MTTTHSDFSTAIPGRLRSVPLCRFVRHALHTSPPSLAAVLLGVGASASMAFVPPAAAFPANFPLVRLLPRAGGDGSEGFVIQGIEEGDRLGYLHVSGAGDINGDGIDDILLGAAYADPGDRPDAGEAYVIFGRATGAAFPVLPLADLLPRGGGDGTAGFVLQGVDSYDACAYSLKAAGDVNGDGIGDVIIGALRADPEERPRAGETYVVFGRSSGFPPVMRLASLIEGDGSAGFVLQGVDPYDQSGRQASGAGDVNGDGIDDIVIGAGNADPGGRTDAGESYVVFGSTSTFPPTFALATLFPDSGGDGSRGFVLEGIGEYDASGLWATEAGDVNGDGTGDLIIGARYADDGDRPFVGEGYVVFGRTTGFPPIFPLARLLPQGGGDGSLGFVLRGIDPYDFAGISVGNADINGDGLSDVIISADRADPGGRSDAGETYVVFGRDTSDVGSFPAVFPLASLLPGAGGDGSAGFVMPGVSAYDRASFSLSGTPDVNGDGIDDLTIGAPYADRGNKINAGEAYVLFGRDGPGGDAFPAVLPLSSLFQRSGGDGSAGFVLGGIDAYDGTGRNGAAGDVNGDGINDLIIAAQAADPGGRTDAGEVYVVFGRPD